jgi:hypothetical protein
MEIDKKLIQTLNYLFDIPAYKLRYSLCNGLLSGVLYTLCINYNFTLSEKLFQTFKEQLGIKLAGTEEVEYEWSEEEEQALEDMHTYLILKK